MNLAFCNLKLEFDIWNLEFGIWNLEFGILKLFTRHSAFYIWILKFLFECNFPSSHFKLAFWDRQFQVGIFESTFLKLHFRIGILLVGILLVGIL
jgi:hypothetical protein